MYGVKQLLLLPLVLLALFAVPGAAAAEEAEPTPMSLQFPQRHATVVGERALVLVECGGEAAAACEGTLVLNGLGGAHKVPYVIQQGARQSVTVPLGDQVNRGCRARVVARTLQWSGGTVRTSSLLRLG
jgi:hypothetical protein